MCRRLWVWQSLTLIVLLRFSLWKWLFTISWVMRIYRVWVKNLEKQFSFLLNKEFCRYPMYLSPTQFTWTLQTLATNELFGILFSLAFRIHNSAQLHPPLNSFFQYFPKAPKLLSTLRMSEVSVWFKNLLRMYRWGGRSRGKLREFV